MMLDLNPVEFDVVLEALRRAMRELREEIYKTDVSDYKAPLKRREAALAAVLKQLEAAEASGLAVGEPASQRI